MSDAEASRFMPAAPRETTDTIEAKSGSSRGIPLPKIRGLIKASTITAARQTATILAIGGNTNSPAAGDSQSLKPDLFICEFTGL